MGPEDVSKMGCPCLGEHTKLEVVIEESYEFKVTQKSSFNLKPTLTPRTDFRASHKLMRDDECQDLVNSYKIYSHASYAAALILFSDFQTVRANYFIYCI